MYTRLWTGLILSSPLIFPASSSQIKSSLPKLELVLRIVGEISEKRVIVLLQMYAHTHTRMTYTHVLLGLQEVRAPFALTQLINL